MNTELKPVLNQPLRGLQQKLVSGEIPLGTLVDEVVERANALSPFNVYIHFDEAALRRDAEKLEKMSAVERAACPLWGLPVSVKDLYDVAGQPTTCGSNFYASTRATPVRDAVFVGKWRQAGALLAGKTNLNEFAFGNTGQNQIYGDCLNPLRPERLSGGSSGGAAASILGGAAGVGLGSDTGLSIRVPATLNGLVGYRNTVGRESMMGAFPLSPTSDAPGWITRHLSDLPWLAEALSGVQSPVVQKPRIAVLEGDWLNVLDEGARQAWRETKEALTSLGLEWVTRQATGWEHVQKTYLEICTYEAARIHLDYLVYHAADYDPIVLRRLLAGTQVKETDYQTALQERNLFVLEMESLWKGVDFLLAPVTPQDRLMAGSDHMASRSAFMALNNPASLAGVPVLALPWPTSEGQSGYGFQVLARRGMDETLFALARLWAGTAMDRSGQF
jgi:Asp-tRNA(Asn)/Glu-tRNA(Gln) amidotransferase A subunit family amidase